MDDVRTKSRADIDSDHRILVIKLKLNLNSRRTIEQATLQQFDAALPRDHTNLNEFNVALKNTFQALQDLHRKKKPLWGTTRRGSEIVTSCQEVLDGNNHQHKQ